MGWKQLLQVFVFGNFQRVHGSVHVGVGRLDALNELEGLEKVERHDWIRPTNLQFAGNDLDLAQMTLQRVDNIAWQKQKNEGLCTCLMAF